MNTGQRIFRSTLSLALLLGASSFAMGQGQPTPDQAAKDQAQGQPATGGYMATQTQPATPEMWDPQRVEQSLKDLGYSDITDLKEEEGRWRFTATRQLTFDPQTGQVVGEAGEPAGAAQPGGAADQAGQQAGQQTGQPATGGYMATQTQPASPEMWEPEALEQGLAEQGFSDVSEIRREGARWRFSARRDNQDLDLTFDPQSGEIRDEADQRMGALSAPATPPTGGYMATQTQPATPGMWQLDGLEDQLSELGYSDVGEVRQEGGQVRLSARKDGQTVDLLIDPQTGDVFTQQKVGSLPDPERGEAEAGGQQQR